MKKKLLFISANNFAVPYPVYPLGLSYLMSYLKPRLPDYEIQMFDIMTSNFAELDAKLKEFQPDYVGVSLRNIDNVDSMNSEFFISHYSSIIAQIRKSVNTKLIIGGSGYSIYPGLLFDTFKPEFGIHGEGEESLLQLLKALDSGTKYEDIEGLVYLADGQIRINARTTFLRDLELELSDDLISYYWHNSGMLNIQTKRGCPYKCIYCTYPLIEGRKVRTLNTEKIVKSLKYLSEEKGIDYFFFTDSVFNLDDKYNEKLAHEIIKSGIKVKWGAYFAPRKLSEEMLILLKEAGLAHIEFGTESLSDTQLKNYGKSFKMKDVFEVSETCNKLDIDFAHFLILGGYGETNETIRETFENSSKIHRTVYFPFVGMRIYPGTPLHKIAIAENVISADDELISPKYYISNNFDVSLLKELAQKSGKRWVFPDEDLSVIMQKMRNKNKKGPLWEYLLK